jgi:hypothetical protein
VKNLGHVYVAPWRGLQRRDRVQENPPSVTESALSRFRYDAIVSNKSFRIATARHNSISLIIFVLFVHTFRSFWSTRNPGDSAFLMLIARQLIQFFKKLPTTPLGRCRPRGILERYFALVFSRRLLHIARFLLSTRDRPLGRGPTGRTPHC